MLLEMLVAMAVGAFLLVVLASLTTFFLRSHDRIMRQGQDMEDTGRALAALSKEIREARQLNWAGKQGGPVFSGTSNRLLFSRDTIDDKATASISAIMLQARVDGAKTDVLRSSAVLPPGATTPESLAWGRPTSLYSGTARFAFAYYATLKGGGEALLDNWPAGNGMPAAIRVSFVSIGPEAKALSLRIPVLVDADLACALPESGNCDDPPRDETQSKGKEDGAAASVDADDPQGWNRYAR